MEDSLYTNRVGENGEYTLRIASEGDLRTILVFFERYGIDKGGAMPQEEKIVFMSPLIPSNNYREIFLRYNVYNFTEEFILLEKDSRIEGVMGFRVPDAFAVTALELSLLAVPADSGLIKDMFDFAVDCLPEVALLRPTKFKAAIPENSSLFHYLPQWGFVEEYKGQDELGWNKNVLFYTRQLKSAV